jgi:hypothetical protein
MKAPRAAALLAGTVALLCAPSCTSELEALRSIGAGGSSGSGGSGGSGGSADRGALLRGTTWSLTWDKARVTPAEGGGWSVDTDRGYRVHVTSGWLVDYSVSLGLCDTGGQGGGGSALGRFFGVRSAYAHEDGNASTIDLQHAEDLTGSLEPHSRWSAAFPAARYCRAHWLAGRSGKLVDSPEGIDLQGRSLVLAGTWERDGALHDLAVSTWWPQGYLVDLDAVMTAAAADDGVARIADITVKRSLGTLFDGIDLASATDEELAGRVLENLALHVEVKAELWTLAGE